MPLYVWNGSEYVRVDDGAGNIQIKNVVYDVNKDGIIDADKIANLSRSKITDFFASPFWDNIPDKPSEFPPEAHTHTKSDITDFAHTHDASDINSGVLSIDRIPNTVLDFYSVVGDVETIYQNPYSDKYLLEIVTVKVENGHTATAYHERVQALIGPSSPPSTIEAEADHYLSGLEYYVTTLVFIVPPRYYYEIHKSGAYAQVSIVSWFEVVLK